MRKVHSDCIKEAVKQMCIACNYKLSKDMEDAIKESYQKEKSPLGKKIIDQMKQNLKIAEEDAIPICQDTGMVVIFVKIGQNVQIEGEWIETAIQNGVREGYIEGLLRKSVVDDPILRNNTNDNTPAIIYYEIVQGDQIELVLTPKGFGSENMSQIYMLKPSDGVKGIKDAIIKTVENAGPNACPPMVIGVGIGGTFEKSALLAKKALTRTVGEYSQKEHIKKLELELKDQINQLKIGPAGLGGDITVLALHIETYATHIAGLPVAINLCCHVNRHMKKII